MKSSKLMCVAALALFVAVPTALASSKWYVDGVNGNDNNDCKTPQTACKTIGHAISLASSGDSIRVAASTYTETLTIGFSLSIVGAGARTTIIDGGGNGTVVTIDQTGAVVTLSGLTIRNGKRRSRGGGISNAGMLAINNSTISQNLALVEPHTFAAGGGIYNAGTLTIRNSTISRNSAQGVAGFNAQGGGIYNAGTLTLNNSTLSWNTVGVRPDPFRHCVVPDGGGIYSQSETVTINNSTLSWNSADNCEGVGEGGGIYGKVTVTLQNTIVANSPNGGNCSGTMTSKGYNLSSDNTCNFNGTGDLNNTDPLLGLLQNNGGPTQTQALLSGSPAIDAGNPKGCTDGNNHLLKTDQRGKPRPDKEDTSGCDMGAYERQKD